MSVSKDMWYAVVDGASWWYAVVDDDEKICENLHRIFLNTLKKFLVHPNPLGHGSAI